MEDKYESLKTRLLETHEFPSEYLFKFVVANSPDKEAEVGSLFPGTRIERKFSRNGRYVSFSVYAQVASADEVIGFYKKAATIDGVISL